MPEYILKNGNWIPKEQLDLKENDIIGGFGEQKMRSPKELKSA